MASKDRFKAKAKETKSMIENDVTRLCDWTSMHGYVWFNRTDYKPLKTFIFVAMLALTIGMVVFMVIQFDDFLYDYSTSDTVSLKTASKIFYPNLTICNSRFFSKTRMEAYGVNNTMANYITLVFESTANQVKTSLAADLASKGYDEQFYADLESELNATLNSKQKDIVGLMDAISISCAEAIPFCYVHNKIYRPCCGAGLFDPDPFYSNTGVCYKWSPVLETLPTAARFVVIGVHMNKDDVPTFDEPFRGPAVSDMAGYVFALGTTDHPAALLQTAPQALTMGRAKVLELSLSETDRTGLSADNTCDDGGDFQSTYNITYTKINCNMIKDYRANGTSCSFLKTSKVLNSAKLVPCLPADRLNTPLNFGSSDSSKVSSEVDGPYFEYEESAKDFSNLLKKIGPGGNTNSSVCRNECLKTRFNVKTQDMPIHLDKIGGIINLEDKQDWASLLMYFGSFEVDSHVISETTLLDFLSSCGGWLGLFVGASTISFIETFVLFCYCMGRSIRDLFTSR